MAGNSKPNQVQRVLKYMGDFGSITALEAMRDLGVMHLASRMTEIKAMGIPFEKRMETVKNRYGENVSVARYWAVKR